MRTSVLSHWNLERFSFGLHTSYLFIEVKIVLNLLSLYIFLLLKIQNLKRITKKILRGQNWDC